MVAGLSVLAVLPSFGADSRPAPVVEATDRVQIQETIANAFVHPGIGLTRAILENARAQVLAQREPWYSGFRKLAANPNSSRTVSCRNQSPTDPSRPDLDAFDSKSVEGRLKQDGDKAFRQALMYYFTGDEVYRANAMKIIRVWSKMNPDKFKAYSEVYIHGSYPVKDLIMAAELMRYTTSPEPELAWTAGDTTNFIGNFVAPAVRTFFNQNGWFMNQNGYALAAAMSGDIFTSDQSSYARRVEWFTVNRTAPNKGWSSSIQDLARLVETNALTGARVDSPQVQLMEMGRDQAHAGDDLEIFVNVARMLNAQGTKVDPVTGEISRAAAAVGPYEFLNDRILAAADYFCRFMLGYDTPWIPAAYDIRRNGEVRGIYPRIADNYRGRIREFEFWDLYYHYTYQRGLNVAKQAPYFYEAFTKRIVSSDFDWIYLPQKTAGEAARVAPSVQEPDVVEVAQRSTCLSSNAFVVQAEGDAFLRVRPTAEGTRIAWLSSDTPSKTIGLHVRTTGVATLALNGFAESWLLPDTRGKWRYVAHTLGKLEHFGDIAFVRVKGSPEITVDFAQLLRRPDARVMPPAFATGGGTLRCVAYVGAPVTLDFSATKPGAPEHIAYESSDLPDGSRLNPQTGAFAWQPAQAGEFRFNVQASAGETIAPRNGAILVAPDRSAAITMASAGFNPDTAYVTASRERYETARAAALRAAATASDAAFFPLLQRLQQAGAALEPLTPLLPDGSMDFPRVVAASNLGEAIGLLVDGNDDTFPVYFLAKDLRDVFDFGPGYTFSATAFAMEGRLNFEDRMADTRFYGSMDGQNWTELTPAATTPATELTRIEVAPNLTNATFRYLRVQKQGGGLFEPAELRIYGRRHETGKAGR